MMGVDDVGFKAADGLRQPPGRAKVVVLSERANRGLHPAFREVAQKFAFRRAKEGGRVASPNQP
jgi:hypothetical protein